MGIVIIVVLLLLTAFVMYLWVDPKVFSAAPAIAGIVLLGMTIWTTVDIGHVKVPNLFGSVVMEELDEGFHFVNPLLSFDQIDVRNFTVTRVGIQVPSQDKLMSTMDVSIVARVDAKQAAFMLQNSGDLKMTTNTYLIPKIQSVLREVGKGVQKSEDFFLDDVQIQMQATMLSILQEYLLPKGIIIDSVLFRSIKLPDSVAASVEATKLRTEQVLQQEQQLAMDALAAQKVTVQAQANDLAATANASAVHKNADAKAYQIATEAKAQAAANKLVAASVTSVLVEYNQINQWNGALPNTVVGGGSSNLLLNLNK